MGFKNLFSLFVFVFLSTPSFAEKPDAYVQDDTYNMWDQSAQRERRNKPSEEILEDGRIILRHEKAEKAFRNWSYAKQFHQRDPDEGLVTIRVGAMKKGEFLCSYRSTPKLYDCVITPKDAKK